MLRLGFAWSIAFVVGACGSSDDGGNGGRAGSSGADGGGSAGQSGSSGQAGRGGSAGTGGTAGRGGTGGSSGTAGRGGSSGAGGRVCGGIAGLICGDSDWCDYPDHCGEGDMQGVCTPKPGACTEDCPGVCGCDGNTYCNACIAQQQGIDVSPTASCSDAGSSGTCTSDNDCTGGLKCCYPCGQAGCSNRCITPDRSGRCPLFP